MDNLPTFVLQLQESWKLLLIYSIVWLALCNPPPLHSLGEGLSFVQYPVHVISQCAVLCREILLKFTVVETCSGPPPPFSSVEIESDSCVGMDLALFFLCHPLLGWSAAGAAIRWVWGHTVVLFWEKGLLCCQVAQLLADTVMALCSLQELQHQLPIYSPPFQPQTNGPHPGSNPCFSQNWKYMWACVCSPEVSGCVHRPRPMALASTDVTGLEEFEECGGAKAGVSILGPGQKGAGELGIGRQLSSVLLASCRADWLEMVSFASPLEMVCSTFMVTALTKTFWRLSAPVIMCLETQNPVKLIGLHLLFVCSKRHIQLFFYSPLASLEEFRWLFVKIERFKPLPVV